jgi:glycosyltransferase involved in cell wall biosynthesis
VDAPAPNQAENGRTLGLLSVVAPVLDEAGLIERFYERVRSSLEGIAFELVLVDDGSTDGTGELIERLAAVDPRVKLLRLSRNFGHQPALTAGLDHASGDAVVMMDSDLQDPPEVIRELVDRWREGSDVVYAVRTRRPGETRFKTATAATFYRLIDKLSPIDLPADAGDFRLLDRRALDALGAMRERSRYLRGMTVWVGFTQTAVPYERAEREEGETKWSLTRMLRFSLDAVTSFSHRPLQAATVLGFVFSLIAFAAIPLVVVARIAKVYVPGVSSVFVAILLLGGIQLICLGLIGEYLGRIYDEVKRRPLYVVRSRRNLDAIEVGAEAAFERDRISSEPR